MARGGDFTKGAGSNNGQIEAVLFFDIRTMQCSPAAADGRSNVHAYRRRRAELAEIEKLVTGGGYQTDRIKIDPSVVRGLEYYTGPVYEAELTFEIPTKRASRALRLGRRRRSL
jgi:histidyl-tRNA synthetase